MGMLLPGIEVPAIAALDDTEIVPERLARVGMRLLEEVLPRSHPQFYCSSTAKLEPGCPAVVATNTKLFLGPFHWTAGVSRTLWQSFRVPTFRLHESRGESEIGHCSNVFLVTCAAGCPCIYLHERYHPPS